MISNAEAKEKRWKKVERIGDKNAKVLHVYMIPLSRDEMRGGIILMYWNKSRLMIQQNIIIFVGVEECTHTWKAKDVKATTVIVQPRDLLANILVSLLVVRTFVFKPGDLIQYIKTIPPVISSRLNGIILTGPKNDVGCVLNGQDKQWRNQEDNRNN